MGRVQVLLDTRGWPSLPALAREWGGNHHRSTAAVVVEGNRRAVLLQRDATGFLVSRTTVRRVGTSWFPQVSTRCSR